MATGAYGYTLADCEAMIAQWAPSITGQDLAGAEVGGVYYTRALAEVQNALLQAGYTVTVSTPIAYQLTHDLLADGVSLYYIETRRAGSYPDGWDPLAGAWGRYRKNLRNIAAGGPWGEFGASQKSKPGLAIVHPVPGLSISRGL